MNAFSLFGFMKMFGTLPPVEGDTPPVEGDTPPAEGDTPPAEGDTPPVEGDTPPVEGDTPPAEGDTPPVEGDTPPAEGDTPPADDNVTGNEMQDILNGLRESLNDKDADISALADSVRSLVDAMDTAPLSVNDLPFDGWRDWWYPVRMEYTVHPWGAGYDMEQSERIETADALLARYNEILGLVGNNGSGKTLKDFYVRYIWDDIDSDEEVLVYDYQAVKEPDIEITVPFEGWEGWAYPITVDFTVHPWGAGYDMEQSQSFDTADAFKTRYGEIVELCKDGGTLKDFYVRYIRDNSGTTVYSYETEDPKEDLTPAILETLQTMDARLERLNATLDDISSVSENTIAFYEDGLRLYRQNNELLMHTLAVDLALLCIVVVMLGHRIAHAFWGRMRIG